MAATDDATPIAGFRAGLRVGFGIQGVIMVGVCLSYGALARETGMSVAYSAATTGIMWALPAQIVFAELFASGASLTAILVAVGVTNARFTPMAVALMPVIRGWGPRKLAFLAVHFVAVTPWALTMRDAPAMPVEQRMPFWLGIGLVNFIGGTAATAAGNILAVSLPTYVSLGLVFLVIAYWSILFTDVPERYAQFAVGIGAILGPVIFLATPEWSLLLGGLIAGTSAYAINRRLEARDARRAAAGGKGGGDA
ncbi:MAG: AzlC family ABC transporter permease [Alphaproteobacteria bacterium]